MQNVEEILLQTPDAQVRVLILEVGSMTDWHRHTEVTDHMVCLQGVVAVEIQGPELELMTLVPGERCSVPKGRVHRVCNRSKQVARYLLIQGGRYDFIREEGAVEG